MIKTYCKIIGVSIILMTSLSPLQAQFNLPFAENYPDANSEIGIEADYFISSDAVTVEFQNTYLSDNFIDNDLKDESFGKMDDRAVLGSGLNGGFYFKKKISNKENKSWFAAAKVRQHYNSNFTTDMFGLYFYGNKRYAGQKADLSDLNYLDIQYNQLQFGFNSAKLKDSSRWDFSYGASLLLGQEYLDISSGRGSFYTHPEAEYVEMDIALKSKQSDTTNTGFGAVNGIGASFDFMAQYTRDGKYHILFGIRDAGLIAWNNKSNSFEIDTLYHFEGIYIESIFDSLFLDIKSEEEFSEGFKKNRKQESFSTMVPMTLEFAYGRILIPKKLTVWGSVNYMINVDYTPLFQVKGDYYFSSRFMGGASIRYGGYAEFGAGLYIGADLGKGFILHGGTSYVTGFVSPSSSTAQGATAGFRKIF